MNLHHTAIILACGLWGCSGMDLGQVPLFQDAGPPGQCSVSSDPSCTMSNSPYWVADPNGDPARGCAEAQPACPRGWVCGTENDAGQLIVGYCQ